MGKTMTPRLPALVQSVQVAAVFVAAGLFVPQHELRAQNQATNDCWTGTWATGAAWRAASVPGQSAPVPAAPAGQPPAVELNNQTLRQIVHTSIGGESVRVVFSNVFGTAPLAIGAAHVALRNKDAAIVTKSGRALTFASKPAATIPAGAVMVSDGVDLALPPQSDLAIDLYFPGNTERSLSPITLHNRGLQTNYVSGPGNHAGAEDLPGATTILVWHWLARVEVAGRQRASAVVTIGDSITDGTASTPNMNRPWPDELARRLLARPRTRHLSVLNVGIGGNRLLSELNPGFGINLLARFDRDVLAQPGAAYAIVLEGINDIGFGRQSPSPPTAADLIAAHHQLVARAHARGLVIYGATLAPFEGANYWS